MRINGIQKQFIVFVSIFCSFFFWGKIGVQAEEVDQRLVNIYFIYSNTCSHCQMEEKLLNRIEKKYQNVEIYCYEVHEEETKEVLAQLEKVYLVQSNGVPITVIGNQAYVGYSEEKSRVKFIKTIEYFSRYSYQDKLGETLKIEKLPEYQEEEAPTLEEFLEEYGNIRMIGNLYTDDLEISMIPILLGFLSGMNVVFFGMILLVVIVLKKVEKEWDKLFMLGFFFSTFFLLFISYVVFRKEIVYGFNGIFSLFFFYGIWRYVWNKKNKSKLKVKEDNHRDKMGLGVSFFIGISLGGNYVGSYFFQKYVEILEEMLILHQFTGIEEISYYLNYFAAVVIFVGLLFVLCGFVVKKIEFLSMKKL